MIRVRLESHTALLGVLIQGWLLVAACSSSPPTALPDADAAPPTSDATSRVDSTSPAAESRPPRLVSSAPLIDANGRIEAVKTVQALLSLHANGLVLDAANDLQWTNFLELLPAAAEQGIKAYLYLPDAGTYGHGPCGMCDNYRCDMPKPYCRDYRAWMIQLASLSRLSPAVGGVFINDFEAGVLETPAAGFTAGFTVDYIQEVMKAKNAINPKVQLIVGVYLPRGLSDYQLLQRYQTGTSDAACGPNDAANLRATAQLSGVTSAHLEFIGSGKTSDCYQEQLWINDEKELEQLTDQTGLQVQKIDLAGRDLSQLSIRYTLIKQRSSCWLEHFVKVRLIADGNEVPLTWSEEAPQCFLLRPYFQFLKTYFDLVDGVLWWANSFDIVAPETELAGALLAEAKRKLPGKVNFSHLYVAHPWKEPVFPSRSYYEDFAAAAMAASTGMNAANPLLPYYVGYSDGVHLQAKSERAGYDYKLHYPGQTGHVPGFFQGIEAEVALPATLDSAALSFVITDNLSKQSGRWVEELVIKSEQWEHCLDCEKDTTRLWWQEKGTAWWRLQGKSEAEESVTQDLTSLLKGKSAATLVVRLRSDGFKWPSSSPPKIEVHLKTPTLTINGKPAPLTWRYASGNAMERQYWREPAEALRTLYAR